jgi:glucosyl-dolichyl phosphate glucuronosyltransferase
MDLSIIICTYNRDLSLVRTLEAISAQVVRGGTSWELIVVDNNSSDGTRSVVEAYRPKTSVPVRYVFEERQGKSFALNSAIEAASGKVLAFTDDDVSPEADWLERIMDVMERNGADGVGGRILPRWSSVPPGWLLAEKDLLRKLAILDFSHSTKVVRGTRSAGIFGANMAFKRELFAELGGFDTGLGPVGSKKYPHEEKDFVDRAVEGKRALL